MGAARLNGRVRDGNGWSPRATVTRKRADWGGNQPDSIFRTEPGVDDGRTNDKELWVREQPQGSFYGQAERAISNGKLHALRRFHLRPIDVLV